MNRQSLRLGRVLVPALLSATVHAQTVVPPVDAGRAIQQTRPPVPQAPKKEPDPVIVQPEDKPMDLPAGQTLKVDEFRFVGAEFIPESELQALVASYRGRSLSMAEIEAAADRITALYRGRGYLVARAYVPKQDASSGTLTIRVVVGRYGKVSLQNRSRVRDPQIDGYFSGLTGDKAATRDELERAMLLVSDLPGARLPTVSVQPGNEPGTSDFDVQVEPGPRATGYVLGDNYGSRYTGRNRLSVGAAINSPFGLGDKLDFSGMGSSRADMLNGRLAYSAPLGSKGLRAELAIARTTYELGDSFASSDAEGDATWAEANFWLPIRRQRDSNLTATLNLIGRKLHDEIAADVTSKNVNAVTVGLNHDRYGQLDGHDSYFSIAGGVTGGHVDIDEADMKALNEAGVQSVGYYGRVNLSMAGRLALSERVSASGSLALQKGLHRNLDGSEQLLVSGTTGVMAYEDALSGDSGYLLNGTLRYSLPNELGFSHSFTGFFNAAHVYAYDGSYAQNTSVTLSDVGVGYDVAWRSFTASAKVAHAIGSWPSAIPTEDRSRTRFLLLVGMFL